MIHFQVNLFLPIRFCSRRMLIYHLVAIAGFLVQPLTGVDVCKTKICTCILSPVSVTCENLAQTNLSDWDFPADVSVLSLANNKLTFKPIEDQWKIGNLTKLKDLNLNGNPLGEIPPLNLPFAQSLALQDTSLTSASFPPIYSNAVLLQRISLSHNRIRTITANDFVALKDARLAKLSLDDASLTQIDRNAFSPLARLQSLSLDNNQLKSCEFLSTLSLLSSIKLDRNQFTSLPEQLTTPNNLKSFSFKGNLISVIDDSSPLYIWQKKSFTNLKVYLANNTIDCCQSRWFIHFLKNSSNLVGDASALICATPSSYAGQKLLELRSDEMNCAGVTRGKLWLWIGLACAGAILLVAIIVLVIFVGLRRQRSRSGYTEIDGVDDPLPTAPPLISTGPVFPEYGDDDDAFSTHQTIDGSEGPSLRIAPSNLSVNT